MVKLFGTDGIRGEANQSPITVETALKVGRAVAAYFNARQGCDRIFIGRDTRLSGDMLEHALAAGICGAGLDVLTAGVVPTPAVAYLVSQNENTAGIVISASHNPWYDNGIKVFGPGGRKLADEVETAIEELVAAAEQPTAGRHTGRVRPVPASAASYIGFLCNAVSDQNLLAGLSVVIDCANGAATDIAPQVFKQLGAELTVLHSAPDGYNINADCGSEHPAGLIRAVREVKADIGLAFDGDADRLIAVDEQGRVVTGDQLIALCAVHYKQNDTLEENCVVTTVMSNIGLKRALADLDITHAEAGVGDRLVMEKMVATGAVVGGENSGHMIFRDVHTTGDGILSALKVLTAMRQAAAPLSELAAVMEVFPQELVAVAVRHKPDLDSLPEVMQAIQAVESKLGDTGRVLVRYSGTQPVCRVMVEGPEQSVTAGYCREIAATVKGCIGA
jgi:phosphoglucosamine mutase